MVMMVIVIVGTFKRWIELLQIKERVQDIWGDKVIVAIEGESCVLPVQSKLNIRQKLAAQKWMG
jgi:hypothetical protein